MTFSSLLFIVALGLVNADGNISSNDLLAQPQMFSEANPIAAPFAKGSQHVLYYAAASGILIVGHDNLKAIDPALSDLESIGIMTAEYFSIRTWARGSDDVGMEIALSEAELLITSSVFEINF